MYTSQSGHGFYDPIINGTPTIEVADPAWIRPTKTITLAPGESYDLGDNTTTNNTAEPMPLTVPDADAVPPTITIRNVMSSTPEDAIEISDADYMALLDGQTAGQMIVFDAAGAHLEDRPPPPPPTTEQVEALRLQAYADPLTGSDRHFAEAARLNTSGDTEGAATATTAGQARYEEIRTENPWPVDPAATKSKAKK